MKNEGSSFLPHFLYIIVWMYTVIVPSLHTSFCRNDLCAFCYYNELLSTYTNYNLSICMCKLWPVSQS